MVENILDNVLPMKQFIGTVLPPVEPIILPDLLTKGGWGLLFGEQETYKSWAALDLAWGVSQGGRWLGHWQVSKQSVLLVNTEIPSGLYQQRCMSMVKFYKSWNKVFVVNHQAGMLNRPGLMNSWCDRVRPGLIIVDNLYRAVQTELNSGAAVNDFLQMLINIREKYNTAMIFVHHARKKEYDIRAKSRVYQGVEDATGSKFLVNNASLIFEFRNFEHPVYKGVKYVQVIREKASFMQAESPASGGKENVFRVDSKRLDELHTVPVFTRVAIP